MTTTRYRWVDGQGRPFSPRHYRPETAVRWLARLPRRWAHIPVALVAEERLPSGRLRRRALLFEERWQAAYAERDREPLKGSPGQRWLQRAQRSADARRRRSLGRLTARLKSA